MPSYTLPANPVEFFANFPALSLLRPDQLPAVHSNQENRPRGYTCPTCMERLFSSTGIALRLDDGLDEPAQDQILDDCILDATDLINQYCLPIYPESELAKSRWVSRRACYLACHFLSQRRGNPAQYQSRHDEIVAELAKVQRTDLHIPRLKVRSEITPSMSNLIVDDRYFQQNIRVSQTSMVGDSYDKQHRDYPYGQCGCGYW